MMANPIENIKDIINLLIANRIDVSDLTESQRKEIYHQANEMINKQLSWLNQILLVPTNANLDIDNWLQSDENYQNGLYLKNLIESFYQRKEEKPQPKQNHKKLKSYVWQNNPDNELPELYSQMKDKYKLIAPETTYEQFKAVFTGQPINEKFKRIKWIKSNRLLAYFLDNCFSGHDWQSIAGNVFINAKDKLLTSNDMAVAKNTYSDYGNPRGSEEIDKLLKDIKNH